MSNNIEAKVVVITGASSGLGEATARLLARRVQALCWVQGALIACEHYAELNALGRTRSFSCGRGEVF
jgi:NAD(P)-dependent dehydrogenase (short-subunit alcohol dehydrogenase family)